MDDALRHVVRPVVQAERAQGQTCGRERDHDHYRRVDCVAAADRGAIRVDDVVEPGALGHQRAHDAILVCGRMRHLTKSYRTNIRTVALSRRENKRKDVSRLFRSPKLYYSRVI